MHAPEFWRSRGILPTLLQPLASTYQAVAALKYAMTLPYRAPVPVVCVGNLVAGGAGKTPVTLSLAALFAGRGRRPHILTRGYGGSLRGPVAVDPAHHTAAEVGDEALLLAAAAPCWVARDRAAGARAASKAGAGMLLLDDGFQNPSLAKDLSFVVVDGAYGFGNGSVMPAGPLRETVAAGIARAQAIVLMGDDSADAAHAIGDAVPILRATLTPVGAVDLAGRRVLAFAGIGIPAKFYRTLADTGAEIVATRDFPDHHPYRSAELRDILAAAAAVNATAITTTKDFVRLPAEFRASVRCLDVAVAWHEPTMLDRLLNDFVAAPARG
ncbi:MAG: lpxK [Rhodospirillales bacterium]|nr:lpxK [Rhodospirillales bacterium]